MSLRDPLEIINSSSRVKLKADPTGAMVLIRDTSEVCLRHHATLALSTWTSSIAVIKMALADLQDIYEFAVSGPDDRKASASSAADGHAIPSPDAANAQRDKLRAALVGLVGVDTREELEQLEAAMRLMPAPAQDKAATIDAIHALIATATN